MSSKFSIRSVHNVKFYVEDVLGLHSVADAMPGGLYLSRRSAEHTLLCEFLRIQVFKINIEGMDSFLHAAINVLAMMNPLWEM